MKVQYYLIPLITLMMLPASAQVDEVDVGFDWEDKSCTESYITLGSGSFKKLDCTWLQAITPTIEGETVDDESGIAVPVDEGTAIEISDVATIAKTPAEKEIIILQAKLEEDGYLPSHESQLLAALLSLKKECELGTEEAAPIQNYELFYIATFEPYTHTDLATQYILKEIEMEIQHCKAQQILKKKVLGAQYLNIPGREDITIPWKSTAILPEEAQIAHDAKGMIDFMTQKSIQFAEEFQCSIEGKQRGLCVKGETAEPIPEPTISRAGQETLDQYNLFRETGEADIPEQQSEGEPDKNYITKQYLKSLGWSDEQINKAITAMEAED